VTAVAGAGDLTHLVLSHEGGASSTATVTLGAPPAAAATNLYVWGEAGRSIMPTAPWDAVDCLRAALSDLLEMVSSGQLKHPCDAHFGREVHRVLATAQAQLDRG